MILWELFSTFFAVGLFTFGGGLAMLPLIQQRVLAHGWLTMEEIANFVAVSESTPGPFAVNIATYVGMETGGAAGAFFATLGVVLPSFLVILLVAKLYARFRASKTVSGVMTGLRPAVVGLLGAALWTMVPTVLFHGEAPVPEPRLLCTVVIGLGAVVAALKKVSPIIIIVCSAAAGIFCGYLIL